MLRRFHRTSIEGAPRLALASFRSDGSSASLDPKSGCIAVRIESDQAEGLVVSAFLRKSPCNSQQALAAFADRLSRSADARLRRAAAGLEELPLEAARRLAADPAAGVRQALAQSGGALRLLSAGECIALAGGDAGFAKLVMSSLLSEAEADLLKGRPKAAELAEKSAAVIGAFREAGDPSVRAEAKAMADELEAAEAKGADREEEAQSGLRRLKRRLRFNEPCLDAGEGGFAFALAFLAEGDNLEREPRLDPEAPVLRLAPECVADAARSLRAEDPKAAEMTERMAESEFAAVRAAAAASEVLSAKAVRALAGDPDYEVRLEAASNAAFLNAVSEEEALETIGGDPELLEHAFWHAQPDLARALKKTFLRSKDAALAELAAGFSS